MGYVSNVAGATVADYISLTHSAGVLPDPETLFE